MPAIGVASTVAGMPPSLVVDALTKRFGSVTAVDSLSFSAPAGCITALVGPNGSGKSTTMRAALGLVRPTTGSVLVDGVPYTDLARPLTHVGAVLDAAAVNGSLSGRAHLRWICRSNRIAADRIDAALARVGMSEAAGRRVGNYSLGMKQRLGIAAAMLGDPAILVLDEPMNGLDPEGMVWLRAFLRQQAADRRIVLLSSHLMKELEGLADRLVIVDGGRLIDDTTVAALLASGSDGAVTLRTTQRVDVMAVLANAGAAVTSTDRETIEVVGLPAERIAQIVAANGLTMHALHTAPPSLETIYLQRTGKAGR